MGDSAMDGQLMGWSAAAKHLAVQKQYSAEKETIRELHALGIDLGKTVFH
jgi:hypothetical protein